MQRTMGAGDQLPVDSPEPEDQLEVPDLAPEPVAADHPEEEHLELFYLASFLLLIFMIFHIVRKHLADSQRKTSWLANMSRTGHFVKSLPCCMFD